MTKFDDKKTLFWCDRLNWHAGQMLTLKKLWNIDFQIFTTILKLSKKVNFGKLPQTCPFRPLIINILFIVIS